MAVSRQSHERRQQRTVLAFALCLQPAVLLLKRCSAGNKLFEDTWLDQPIFYPAPRSWNTGHSYKSTQKTSRGVIVPKVPCSPCLPCTSHNSSNEAQSSGRRAGSRSICLARAPRDSRPRQQCLSIHRMWSERAARIRLECERRRHGHGHDTIPHFVTIHHDTSTF